MVGDNLEWEVVAPQRLGIFSVWYDGTAAGVPVSASACPDLVVTSLRGVLAALGLESAAA